MGGIRKRGRERMEGGGGGGVRVGVIDEKEEEGGEEDADEGVGDDGV